MELLKRFYELLKKVLSVKGLVLGLATYALFTGTMSEITWGFFAAALIGVRTLEKYMWFRKEGK
jgi:hypothetical protein